MPGPQIGWLYAAIPLGAVISPLFISPIADRFFAAQKVTSVLHFLGGLCLLGCGILCATGNQTFSTLMTLILLSGICFMPTIPLVNTIVFKHMPSPTMGPYVFVFGTFGWIFVNLFIAAFTGGAATPYFFYVGAGCSIILSLYVLTLPNTPPKGAPAPGEKSDALGLGALKMFKDPSFAIFAVLVFLASIPACNYFFPAQVSFLTERGYPSPLALTTLNQFSEIAFMAALPFFVARFGLKNVLLVGMGAWSVRYLCFGMPGFSYTVIGLVLHGFCYSFLYVAAYMYTERKAPANLKASAQGLMTFLLLGVGQVAGSLGYGFMHDAYPPQVVKMVPSEMGESAVPVNPASLPAWNDAKMENSAWRYLDLGSLVAGLTQKGGEEEKITTGNLGLDVDKNKDNAITVAELTEMPAQLVYGEVTYDKGKVVETFAVVREKLGKPVDAEITREEWLQVQAYDWRQIWILPAIWIAVCFVLFLLLGKNPTEVKE